MARTIVKISVLEPEKLCTYMRARVMTKITVTGSADYNVVIEGGDDSDEIDLKGLSLTGGAYAVALGGAGNDYILGVDDGVNFLFGENARIVLSEDKRRFFLQKIILNFHPQEAMLLSAERGTITYLVASVTTILLEEHMLQTITCLVTLVM